MGETINVKKLLEQDQSFRDWLAEVWMLMAEEDEDNLRYMYSMYMAGLEPKQIGQIHKYNRAMRTFDEDEDE